LPEIYVESFLEFIWVVEGREDHETLYGEKESYTNLGTSGIKVVHPYFKVCM
jgi:hypothetical protein